MGYLDRAIIKRILLDQSEDDDLTVVVDINGYEIIAIITPAALDGAALDLTPQIDPGNGTFYTPLDDVGAALTWWVNVGVNEYLFKDASVTEKLVGAKVRLSLSAGEAADREFWLVLLALPGSAE